MSSLYGRLSSVYMILMPSIGFVFGMVFGGVLGIAMILSLNYLGFFPFYDPKNIIIVLIGEVTATVLGGVIGEVFLSGKQQ